MRHACKIHLEATLALTPVLAALPPDISRVIARLLQNDIELLSVAAIQSRSLMAELDHLAPAVRESAEALRAAVSHLLKAKIDLLAPVAFGGPGATASLPQDR